jgi:hypothetical protein
MLLDIFIFDLLYEGKHFDDSFISLSPSDNPDANIIYNAMVSLAYMVISIAFWVWCGRTFVSLLNSLRKIGSSFHIDDLFGLLMPISIISQVEGIRFDSYLLFSNYSHIWRLFITYLLFFIPFFLSALAIGIVFVKYVDRIGELYFANLIGSGLGGIAAIGFLFLFFPENLPVVVSILPLISGIILITKRNYQAIILSSILALIVIVISISYPHKLVLSQYKSLSKTLNLPGTKIINKQNVTRIMKLSALLLLDLHRFKLELSITAACNKGSI